MTFSFHISNATKGGGLAAVIYIDVVQVVIMVTGSLILLFRGLNEVGGWENLQKRYLFWLISSGLMSSLLNFAHVVLII